MYETNRWLLSMFAVCTCVALYDSDDPLSTYHAVGSAIFVSICALLWTQHVRPRLLWSCLAVSNMLHAISLWIDSKHASSALCGVAALFVFGLAWLAWNEPHEHEWKRLHADD